MDANREMRDLPVVIEISDPVPRAFISGLKFSDNSRADFASDDVVVIVGPNNGGKSAALRGIRYLLEDPAYRSPVLKELSVEKIGTSGELLDWLDKWAVTRVDSPPSDPIMSILGHAVHKSSAAAAWTGNVQSLGQVTRIFCHLLTTDERLQISQPPTNISLVHDAPTHPIHAMQRDDALEERLSKRFSKAFGVDLIVHRNAGTVVPLYVGKRPAKTEDEDRTSLSYVRKIEALPKLHEQGDGMRSFAGVLLATSVGRESIMLIDEPEAFLHPPQARLLGASLVRERLAGRQLFVATHSSDVLRGVLDSESKHVRVVRIQRKGDSNEVRLLDNIRIKDLWSDPLLRHSNIFDGLFHEGVIVCEADSDCRFYAAVLEATYSGEEQDKRRPDLMFTHCGGKDRLAVVTRALREVGVPVHVVADFDILSSEQPLRNVASALGIDWGSVEADWKIVKNAVDNKKPDLDAEAVKQEIDAVFKANSSTKYLPHSAKDEIQKLLKKSSGWANAKAGGKNFVPNGGPFQACERLLIALRACGLHVVEEGELEGFVRSVSDHGPKFVNAVLTKNLETDPELEIARKFVRTLVRSMSN